MKPFNLLLAVGVGVCFCLCSHADEPREGSAAGTRAKDSARMPDARYAYYLLRQFDKVLGETGLSALKPVAELQQARAELERQPPALSSAVRLIEKAANNGDAAAQYLMGYVKENEMPFEGQTEIRGDVVAAAEWYEKAAAQKMVPAMLALGGFNAYGKLGKYDIEAAVLWWEMAANAGSVEAMGHLGWLYQRYTPEMNTRVAPQYEKAFEWYHRAAEKGDGEAMYQLARQYHFGKGTGQDDSQSRLWLIRAAGAGYSKAGLVMSGMLGFETDLMMTKNQADSHSALTTNGPSGRYANAENVTEDELLMAMNSGSQEARLVLAEKYEFGLGVKKDLEKALEQYWQVAHISEGFRPRWISARASEAIVRIYASGMLQRDVATTEIGIKNPEQLPSAAARFQFAELYWRGNTAVKANPTNAIAWYLHAACAGSAPAMRRLGEFWRDGVNGSPDPAEAERWFQRAAAWEKQQLKSP